MCVDELDDVVLDLCRRHPRFRRVTIERLVARMAEECRRECNPWTLNTAVCRRADEQLTYLDSEYSRNDGPGAETPAAAANR